MKKYSENHKFKVVPLVSALLFLSLAAVAALPKQVFADNSNSSQSFKVASFNLHTASGATGADRMRLSVDFANRNGFDIIGAQELGHSAQFNTAKAAGFFGKSFSSYPKQYVSRNGANRSAIFFKSSRFSLVSGGTLRYQVLNVPKTQKSPESGEAPYVLLKDKLSQKQFYVMNIHNAAYPWWGKVRHDNIIKVRDLVSKLSNKGVPVILTGDFNENSTVGNGTYQKKRANLAYCLLTKDNLMRYAPDALRGKQGACPTTDYNAIDRVYVSKGVKVLNYAMLPAGAKAGTDHRIVALARLAISVETQQTPSGEKKCKDQNRVWKDGKCTSDCVKNYVAVNSGSSFKCVQAKVACESIRHRVWKNGACTKECQSGFVQSKTDKFQCEKKKSDASDRTAPKVQLSLPAPGAVSASKLRFAATASDNVGVSKVEFYANDKKIVTDSKKPYSKTWDVTKVANGSYSIYAKAYDAAGNKAVSKKVSVIVDKNHKDTSSVINLKTADGKKLKVTFTGDCVKNVSGKTVSSPSSLPANLKFVYGVAFIATCGNKEESAQISVTSDGLINQEALKVFKQKGESLVEITDKVVLTEDLTDASTARSLIAYSLTDGGELDQDGQANSRILDPIIVAIDENATDLPVVNPPAGTTSQGKGPGILPNTGTSLLVLGLASLGALAGVITRFVLQRRLRQKQLL